MFNMHLFASLVTGRRYLVLRSWNEATCCNAIPIRWTNIWADNFANWLVTASTISSVCGFERNSLSSRVLPKFFLPIWRQQIPLESANGASWFINQTQLWNVSLGSQGLLSTLKWSDSDLSLWWSLASCWECLLVWIVPFMAPSLPRAFRSCRELVSSMLDSEFEEAFRIEVSLK